MGTASESHIPPPGEFDPAKHHKPGDVFQITEAHGRSGWIGAFVMATEIKPWGIQGFVAHIETHDKQSSIFIRLRWEEIAYIGSAVLVPPLEED